MRLIKNVVVAGGSGNLGPDIVRALLAANFTVSILSRHASTPTSQFGGPVRIVRTDYSAASLDLALTDQDAVVSTLGWGAESNAQTKLLKAVVKSASSKFEGGVQRFIPSEFGMPNLNIEGHPEIVKMIQGRLEFRDKMIHAVQENPKLSYTGIFTSLWLDWGLRYGLLGFDLYNQSADIVDSGNQPFNACDMATIGLAVTRTLQNPAKTGNKYITITSHKSTKNEILKELERKTGSSWSITYQNGPDSYRTGWRMIQSGYNGWPKMLQSYVFRDRNPPINAPGTLDGNELLEISYKSIETAMDEVTGDLSL